MGEFEKEWNRQMSLMSHSQSKNVINANQRFVGLFKAFKKDKLGAKRADDQKRFWWSR